MNKKLGTGTISLLDLNDGWSSDLPPNNPSVGNIWIDLSVTPNMIKRWNGSLWVELGELDPDLSVTIEKINSTLGNMSNDGVIDFKERQIIKDKLTDIIGYIIGNNQVVPSMSSSAHNGQFKRIKLAAQKSGMNISHEAYININNKYTDLQMYLNQFNDLRLHNTGESRSEDVVQVNKEEFRNNWLNYYIAVEALAEATTEQLKKNVEDVDVGGRNLVGEFNLKEWAQSSDRVVQSSVGLSYVIRLDPNKDYVVHRKNKDNNNRFRLFFYDIETENENDLRGIDISKRLPNTTDNELEVKFNSENYTWLILYVTNQRDIDDISKAFIKLERGNKATDFTNAPEDDQKQIKEIIGKITDVESRITDDSIVNRVTSSEKFIDKMDSIDRQIDNIRGEVAYRSEIVSTNGTIFKNSNINTTLSCRVYKGTEDITSQILDNDFNWKRISDDHAGDIIWNDQKGKGRNSVTITNDDVMVRATFTCEVGNASILNPPKIEINNDYLSKVPRWLDDYHDYLMHNTKSTGNIAINNLGLVGGKFVIDDHYSSYTPPTTSASEAQLLTTRGALKCYLATRQEKWLQLAWILTGALLKYYYPEEEIPSTPDAKWVPHWLVNVTAPFKSREFFLDGEAGFINGVSNISIPGIVRIFTIRSMDSSLAYDWAPDAPVIGTELEAESIDISYGEGSARIELKDKSFAGTALISYVTETGRTVEVGDKCEAYPVWRHLNEGEIACAIDTLSWALDVFNLWYKITEEDKWIDAIESTKLSLKVASEVDNTDYYIKPGRDSEPVLINGVTSYSQRNPKETYRNRNGLILINYAESTGEASMGTWVGDRVEFSQRKWLEIRAGSDKVGKFQLKLDEDSEYDPNKRWESDFWLKGNGLSKDRLEHIEFHPNDFYKTNNILWGIGYGKTGNGGEISSENSSIIEEEIVGDVSGSQRLYKELTMTRGDEGGWLGWCMFLLSIWEQKLPKSIKYKTNNNIDLVVKDFTGVEWRYKLPITGTRFFELKLRSDMFTTNAENANHNNLNIQNVDGITLEAIDKISRISIDYIGEKETMKTPHYSSLSFSYAQEQAIEVALEYIKPAPSRDRLPYSPYILPFDFHLINYEVSNLRGAIYTGYQAPWIYQNDVFEDNEIALRTNLEFLQDAQKAYRDSTGIYGFFVPIFWWNYLNDYNEHEPNTFNWHNYWGNWGGFQYRTFSDVAKVLEKDPRNQLALNISLDFANSIRRLWGNTYNTFPDVFERGESPKTLSLDPHIVSNFMRGLIYMLNSSNLNGSNKRNIIELINKCLDYLNNRQIPIDTGFVNSEVEGTFSPNPVQNEWYQYWGGDILDGLGEILLYTSKNQ